MGNETRASRRAGRGAAGWRRGQGRGAQAEGEVAGLRGEREAQGVVRREGREHAAGRAAAPLEGGAFEADGGRAVGGGGEEGLEGAARPPEREGAFPDQVGEAAPPRRDGEGRREEGGGEGVGEGGGGDEEESGGGGVGAREEGRAVREAGGGDVRGRVGDAGGAVAEDLPGVGQAVAVEVGGGGRGAGVGVGAVAEAVAVCVARERAGAEGGLRAVGQPVEVGVGHGGVGAVDEQLVVGGEAVAVVVADIGVEHAEGAPAQFEAVGGGGGVVPGEGLAAAVVPGADEEVGEGVAARAERGIGGHAVAEGEVAVFEEFGLEGDRAVGVAPGVEVLPGQQQAARGRGRVPEAPLRRHGAEAAVQRREQAGVLGHGGGGRRG